MPNGRNNADHSQHPRRFKPLTVAQESALDLLIMGQSDAAVGRAVGVDRATVWKWRHEHPVFAAELERRRGALFYEGQERLRALALQAVEAVEAALAKKNVRVALEVLKGIGLLSGHPSPILAQDPEQRLQAMVEHELAQAVEPDPLQALLAEEACPGSHRRKQAIEARLRAEYCEDEDG
jgi:transposase-like protein